MACLTSRAEDATRLRRLARTGESRELALILCIGPDCRRPGRIEARFCRNPLAITTDSLPVRADTIGRLHVRFGWELAIEAERFRRRETGAGGNCVATEPSPQWKPPRGCVVLESERARAD